MCFACAAGAVDALTDSVSEAALDGAPYRQPTSSAQPLTGSTLSHTVQRSLAATDQLGSATLLAASELGHIRRRPLVVASLQRQPEAQAAASDGAPRVQSDSSMQQQTAMNQTIAVAQQREAATSLSIPHASQREGKLH